MTPSVGRLVIFSMPPTSTMSYMPLAMAMTPSRRALPLLAQAFSMRVIGYGGHAQPVGDYGRCVPLGLEQVRRVVADVGALDVVNVEGLVHGFHHVLESLDKESRLSLSGNAPNWERPAPTMATWRPN